MVTFVDILKLSDLDIANINPPQEIHYDPITRWGVRLFIKREELLDPLISGNKVYKLLHHLRRATSINAETLISFGGYHSNHLHALAAAGRALHLKTLGIVRGVEPKRLNETLQDCLNWGMELRFVTREQFLEYRNQDWKIDLSKDYPSCYVIPEGGGGKAGTQGCSAIMQAVEYWQKQGDRGSNNTSPSCVCVPCGTGTTLAGMVLGNSGHIPLLGFSALKPNPNRMNLTAEVNVMLEESIDSTRPAVSWSINENYHFGGFAKVTPELLEFMKDFEDQTSIELDPVYTAKMLFAIKDLASKGYWPEGQQVVAIHTGGLQGRRSLLEKLG